MNWVNTSLIGVFVVSACPDRLFETLKKAPVAKYIQTLLEINVSFIAYESQVMKVLVWWCLVAWELTCGCGFTFIHVQLTP